jgi:hypothetical protein
VCITSQSTNWTCSIKAPGQSYADGRSIEYVAVLDPKATWLKEGIEHGLSPQAHMEDRARRS